MLYSVLDVLPEIPIASGTSNLVNWITKTFSFFFDPLKDAFGSFMDTFSELLLLIPPLVVILIIAVLAFFITGRKISLAIFSVISLWLVYNQGIWDLLVYTFALVVVASALSVAIGIPIGILMSKSKIAEQIMTPVLDFMQTMPAFVYLIPAVAFFGIGMVPGVFASLIFATPPTVRLTNLGIKQVSRELVEASEAYGSTGIQKLFKVELPMARASMMAGVNQTIMLALSMVVIASMIGANGLGKEVLSALQRAETGAGFVGGIGIVILAIIMDRFTKNVNVNKYKV